MIILLAISGLLVGLAIGNYYGEWRYRRMLDTYAADFAEDVELLINNHDAEERLRERSKHESK